MVPRHRLDDEAGYHDERRQGVSGSDEPAERVDEEERRCPTDGRGDDELPEGDPGETAEETSRGEPSESAEETERVVWEPGNEDQRAREDWTREEPRPPRRMRFHVAAINLAANGPAPPSGQRAVYRRSKAVVARTNAPNAR